MTVSTWFRPSTVLLSSAIAVAVSMQAAGQLAQPAPPPALAARIDPYTEKVRVLVLTDIANEPDDQMSMVRFLVYSNQFDVEGLVATTSTWMRNRVRPDVIER
jgi:cellulose-binding protein